MTRAERRTRLAAVVALLVALILAGSPVTAGASVQRTGFGHGKALIACTYDGAVEGVPLSLVDTSGVHGSLRRANVAAGFCGNGHRHAYDSSASSVAPRAGAGGDGAWHAIDEVQGGAVGQAHNLGCVEACGEMLSGIPQSALSANSAEALASQLGSGWRAGYVGSGQFDSLMGTGPWGAELIQGGRVPHHMVVVDGFASNGNLVIRDPWAGGSTYQMTRDGFLDAWSGIGVFGG